MILKTNVAVGYHLINIALEEVSVEFRSTILKFILPHSRLGIVQARLTLLSQLIRFTLGIKSKFFCTRLIK